MTHYQRLWLTASLVVIAVALAAVALEWDARPPRDAGFGVLVVSRTGGTSVAEGGSAGSPGPGAERLHHGLFVRREWGPIAAVWGGVFPLALVAAAGFVVLGRHGARGSPSRGVEPRD